MIKLKSLLLETNAATQVLQHILDYPIDKFADKFKTLASDKRIQAVIQAGLTDGKPNDEKITFAEKSIPVKNLLPTQNEIGFEQSLKVILVDQYKQVDKFLEGGSITVSSPIVVLNSKWIIDGHHRWSQLYICNPEASIRVVDFKVPQHPETILKAVHLAIVADTGEMPTATVKGQNLLNTSEGKVKKYVTDTAIPECTSLYYKHEKISNNNSESLASYIWNNVSKMKQNNAPKPWAADRKSMPQTDDSTDYKKLLSKGMVNFIAPKDSDVK
jgi:hypothetical protein